MPAKAGIQLSQRTVAEGSWIPACAGMTWVLWCGRRPTSARADVQRSSPSRSSRWQAFLYHAPENSGAWACLW